MDRKKFIYNSLLLMGGIRLKGKRRAVAHANYQPPAPFDPANLPNLAAWYDITDSSSLTISSGRATVISDKSGNGRHLNTAWPSGAFPAYSSSGGGNNKAFITMGGNDAIRNTSMGISNPAAIYMVLRFQNFTRTDVPGQGVVKTAFTINGRTDGLIYDDVSLNGYRPVYRNYLGSNYDSIYDNVKTTNWQFISMDRISTQTRFSFNDQPNGFSCQTALNQSGLGEFNFGYYSLTAPFEFSECIIVDTAISDANDKAIKAYFNSKYNITPEPYILYFGDSLTVGNCDSLGLHPFLTGANTGRQVVNYATGGTVVFPNNGSTGVSGKNFSDKYSEALRYAVGDCYVHLGFGVNDVNQGGINAAWKTGYKSYIQSLIDYGYDASKIIIVKQPATSIRQATMASCWTYIGDIATEMGLTLYDANARFLANGGDTLFGDTLHPNSAGNIVYADGMNLIIP